MFFYVRAASDDPRFRFDQLMGIAWKVLFPLAIANILITAFIRLISIGEIFWRSAPLGRRMPPCHAHQHFPGLAPAAPQTYRHRGTA